MGGGDSATIDVSECHPSLESFEVMLVVIGYTVGTYMAWVCWQIVQVINQT